MRVPGAAVQLELPTGRSSLGLGVAESDGHAKLDGIDACVDVDGETRRLVTSWLPAAVPFAAGGSAG